MEARTGLECNQGGMMHPEIKDRRREVFGKLTVIRDTGKRCWGGVVWECRCECGRLREVRASNLESGNTRSCGRSLRNSDGCVAVKDVEIRPGQAWMLPNGRKPVRVVHDVMGIFVDYAGYGGVRQTRTMREFEVWVNRYGATAGS